MKAQEFVKAVEAYYGAYERPLVRRTVLAYVEQFGPEIVRQIYQLLLLEFSGQYKMAPDVAAIEKIRRGMNEERSDGVYRHGRRVGHYDGSRFIPDLALLSEEGVREYVAGYENYADPQGYCRLLQNHTMRQLAPRRKES